MSQSKIPTCSLDNNSFIFNTVILVVILNSIYHQKLNHRISELIYMPTLENISRNINIIMDSPTKLIKKKEYCKQNSMMLKRQLKNSVLL